MIDEQEVITAALREHHRVNPVGLFAPYGCSCGRTLARGYEAHAAEEIVYALTEHDMGVFPFERLGLLEDDR